LAVTLAGNTLYVWHDGFEERRDLVRTESKKWDATLAKVIKNIFPIGSVRSWILHCFEESVDWNNSIVKTIQGYTDDNTTVAFVVAIGTLHTVVATTVKVLSIRLLYPRGSNIGTRQRNFVVNLQEVL